MRSGSIPKYFNVIVSKGILRYKDINYTRKGSKIAKYDWHSVVIQSIIIIERYILYKVMLWVSTK